MRFYLSKYPIHKLPQPTKLQNIKHILLFSNTALGDTMMSTPAIVQTRRAFPSAKITLFISKTIYPLFQNYEYVDDFLVYQGGYKSFISDILKMRRLKPDLVLMFHSNGPMDIPSAILSGAKYILKTSRNNDKEQLLSTKLPLYAHFIPARLQSLSYITLENYDNIQMKLPAKYHAFSVNMRGGDIGFQMRTSKERREWGIENFAKLATMILESHATATIFLSGTLSEREYSDQIYSFIPKDLHKRIHNHCGKYSLDELPYFLKSLHCFITGDTGPMHLCGALGIPSIALFLGGASPAGSGILQDREIHIEIQQESPEFITPHQIFESLETLIKKLSINENKKYKILKTTSKNMEQKIFS